jgi:hypothetical protein
MIQRMADIPLHYECDGAPSPAVGLALNPNIPGFENIKGNENIRRCAEFLDSTSFKETRSPGRNVHAIRKGGTCRRISDAFEWSPETPKKY